MKGALYLLPSAALLVLLCRMVAVRLHAERPALFVFLAAWFAYSVIALLLFQQTPFDATRYARAFSWLTAGVWLFGAVSLWPALERVCASGARAFLFYAATGVAVWLAVKLVARGGTPEIARTLVLCCAASLVAGAAWLVASFAAGEGDPDRLLWRGLGAFFFLYGAGSFAARITREAWAETGVVFAGAAVWLALAWFIAPNPELLWNPEKLGVVSGQWLVAGEDPTSSPIVPCGRLAASHRDSSCSTEPKGSAFGSASSSFRRRA